MKRKCACSGPCGPQLYAYTRREFLGLSAAGAAGLLAWPARPAGPVTAEEINAWRQRLLAREPARLYLSDRHADARMPLGGIGTGNLELGADGQFTNWQLFNTLRDGQVPFAFGVQVGEWTRLLQTAGGPAMPRVQRIEMTGEYPVARLRYLDPALPVQVELEAFSPFAPLETEMASVPVAVLVFRVTNAGTEPREVSLAGVLRNPVGYDATTAADEQPHPQLGGNVNEPLEAGAAKGWFMRAVAGREATLDQPVRLYVSDNLQGLRAPPPDRPESLTVEWLDRVPAVSPSGPGKAVIWIEEPAADFPEARLRAVRDAVRAGATLVLAGQTLPLVSLYARTTRGRPLQELERSVRPDLVFADFERGYEGWTVEGAALGQEPARGTLPHQQRVAGFLGSGLVNTYYEGDATTGRAVSREFTIERRFIRFLIGGGSHRNTQLRLRVGDQVVRAAAGKDNERLEPMSWEVAGLEGQRARLEIVDEATGPWGHVNVDHLEFSDHPSNPEVLALLEELLPVRCVDVRPAGEGAVGPNSVGLDEWVLREGASTQIADNGLRLFAGPVGQGRVVLATGSLLSPAQAHLVRPRQQAYALVCALAGCRYQPLEGPSPKAPGFGSLALVTLGPEATMASAADEAALWDAFARTGRFAASGEGGLTAGGSEPTLPGRTVCGGVATRVRVPAGSTVELPFLLTWHYPNKYNGGGEWMGNHYATRWSDARAVVREAASQWSRWRELTGRFRERFYDSTLPYWLLDCVTSQASTIRYIGVVFRIANGDLYGWEGSNGCCQPTCTHVWGYEQTLACLFPDLERIMRRIDFEHQQREDGGINNRTDVPSPRRPTGEQPFADGHASSVLKVYREALHQPDEAYFNQYWPGVKRAVDYLVNRDAQSNGGQPAGVLQDDQWNTYDQTLHGITTFIGTYYLAALRAGEEWGRRVGDRAAADRFREVFELGQKRLVERCWTGEYFRQWLPEGTSWEGEVGPGCLADQLIGQWWAHQLGLGYVLPREQVVTALRAVVKHNWRPDLTGWKHAPRAFAGDRDKGLLICTWPHGGRPQRVMLYSDEVWTGIEYQVAAHLIYEGLVEEGMAVARAARDRYDGIARPPIQRNPWNEIECGGHYARAMSSASLLLALSGWYYDGPRQALRIEPRLQPEDFRCWFVGSEGWGNLAQRVTGSGQQVRLDVAHGELGLARLAFPAKGTGQAVRVIARGQPVELKGTQREGDDLRIEFASPVRLRAGERLEVSVG